MLIIAIGLAACSRSDKGGTKLSKRIIPIGQPVPKGGGRYKVGNPYQIQGRWYHPKEDTGYDQVGVASWYGDLFHGRHTANGEIFDMEALTAAHPTLPMPVYAEVTNLENGRSMVVRINDRGPYAHNREIDLSKRTAKALGVYRPGTAKVRVRYLGKAPLNGDDSYEQRVLASKPWGRHLASKDAAPKIYAKAVADTIDNSEAPVRIANTQKKQPAEPMMVASAGKPREKAEKSFAQTAALRGSSPDAGVGELAIKGPLIFVQLGAFRNRDNAENVRDRLKGLGQVYVYPAEVSGKMWYRVRLGPYRESVRAREALARAVQSGARRAQIVKN